MTENSTIFSWEAMIERFRQFGGVVENVERRHGQHGHGLFVIDPNKPYKLHVPEHLLVDATKIVRDGEGLRIDPSAGMPEDYREWFFEYQRHYSWGQEGYSTTEAFESGLKALPEATLQKLKVMGLLNLDERQKGEWHTVVLKRFLQSRRLKYKDKVVIMPVVELINHSPNVKGFNTENGILVQGSITDEVYVNYSVSDSLRRFLAYGFVCEEPQAYSRPLQLPLGESEQLQVLGQIGNKAKQLKLIAPEPKVTKVLGMHALDFVLLGADKTPRIPRALFKKSLHEYAFDVDLNEMFDRIRSINQINLCELYQTLEGIDTPVAQGLRQVILYQLKAMAHCYGERDTPSSQET